MIIEALSSSQCAPLPKVELAVFVVASTAKQSPLSIVLSTSMASVGRTVHAFILRVTSAAKLLPVYTYEIAAPFLDRADHFPTGSTFTSRMSSGPPVIHSPVMERL